MLLFALLALLCGGAIGPIGAASLLAVAMTSILMAVHAHGPPADDVADAAPLQLYLIIVAVPVILLAATIAERGKAEESRPRERYREVGEPDRHGAPAPARHGAHVRERSVLPLLGRTRTS